VGGRGVSDFAENRAGAGVTVVALVVVAFLELPVVVIVLAAFSKTAYLTIPPRGLTLAWFAKVMSDPDYLSAIRMSLILACGSTVISLVLGVAAAYALFRKIVPGADAIGAFLMSPLILPGVVIGVALLQFYSLTSLRGTLFGLVMAHVVITVPYVVRSALASLGGLDMAQEEAARVLGADGFDAFRLVTLPLIAPGLVAGGLFAFVTFARQRPGDDLPHRTQPDDVAGSDLLVSRDGRRSKRCRRVDAVDRGDRCCAVVRRMAHRLSSLRVRRLQCR
jgi:putative spermidine/putrescine transport system permease protein